MQTDLLDGLNVRSVAPLLPQASAPIAAKRQNPVFRIAGSEYVMMIQFIAAVPVSALKVSIGTLVEHFDQITTELDMLFHGYCQR